MRLAFGVWGEKLTDLLGVQCGEWKVQLDFGRVMQFEVDGSDFEHGCFMNGHSIR